MTDTAADAGGSRTTIPAHELVGLYVTASSAGRGEMHGVLLPPTPRSRGTLLRLSNDDGTVSKLKPAAWTFRAHHSLGRDKFGRPLATASRISGCPTYRYGDLPAQHLATKTMLRRDRRRQPAPGQPPIAYYDAKESWAPLYAVADSVLLPPLPAGRAEAFALVRTCCVCTQVFERPLQKSPDGDRYCEPCHLTTIPARWAEQIRPVQAEMADWARAVLADPTAVLAKTEYHWVSPLLHVETLHGKQLLHARLRGIRDVSAAAEPDKFAGTVHATEILPQLNDIAGRRIITWDGLNPHNLTAYDEHGNKTTPALDSGPNDRIAERYALWCGRAPRYRSGFWIPRPQLPWNHTLTDDQLYRTAADAEGALQTLRYYLKAMATEPAPEPIIPKPGA